ncbi:MAG: glycosyltransferase family 4 protein [Bacteroidales bacterium]|nr:glycosyltransferase family 4 protein [Bacteroidales bacterium]
MDVVALVSSPDHVCCRYRLEAFRPALETAGHTLTYQTLPRNLFARLPSYRHLRSADVVIVQRKLLPPTEVNLLRRYAKRVVFDYDDAVWFRDSYSPKGFFSRRRTARFRAIAQVADLMVAGNAVLAAEGRRHAIPGRVVTVPTCVEPSFYPVAVHSLKPSLTLVWVGSSSTLRGLERFRSTLEAIGQAVPGVRLKLVCDQFLQFQHLPVDPVPWSALTEAGEIAAADIGIGWVPDDPWSRGKCGLKVLQYQAAGLPVIANPVGVQADFVRDGVTGFRAETTEEWIAAVRKLAEDAALRQRLGQAGRTQVLDKYSVAVGGTMWVELLQRLAGGHPLRRAG